jgi:O-antigen/teichoic acid export membrane protein
VAPLVDANVKRRLTLGAASNLIGKFSGSLIQLVQVPIFLHFWSVPLFGEWMIVSAIPTYLGFSNMGFGSVAYNEMTMAIAAGDQEKALRVFQSCWWLIVSICIALGATLGLILYLLPIDALERFHAISVPEAKLVLLFLGFSVLLGQLEQLLGSAYTCVGRYPYGAFLKNMLSLAAFAATMIPVCLHYGVSEAAATAALANACGTLYLCISVRRDVPWIKYGWKHARYAEIRRLTSPAIAFMAFPLGNAMNLQGSILAVGYALGSSAVVVFGTARTVSRVALQVIQMVNLTVWPELSSAYGARNWQLVRMLHRRSCQLALILATLMVTTMLTLGPWFLNLWTDGHVAPNRLLLSLLLLVVVLNALWSTSSTVAVATNKHHSLAFYYVLATGVTLAFTYICARYFGLYGAVASLLIAEVIMNLYVLPNSLRISHDRLSDFIPSLFHLPDSLRFRGLLRLLNEFRPSRTR